MKLYRCTAIRAKSHGDRKYWGRSYFVVATTPKEAQAMVRKEEPNALCITRCFRMPLVSSSELYSYTRDEVEDAARRSDDHDDTLEDEPGGA